jgi:serine/threonine protein kinase
LIVLADGGTDLESFQFDSTIGWKQAAGVFWQTVDALARAEQWTAFEVNRLQSIHLRASADKQHRDLHEGQILISPAPLQTSHLGSDCLSESDTGVKVTIIDFGLSRLSIPGKSSSTWSDLPPEVYEGKGDQWDVYRSMRDVIGEDWAGFHPETNVLVCLLPFSETELTRTVDTIHHPVSPEPNEIIEETTTDPSSPPDEKQYQSKIRYIRTWCDRSIRASEGGGRVLEERG